MSRILEDQMRLSLRGIISKQMREGSDKHRVLASFISDNNGFPLVGLKKRNDSIVDMEIEEFEQLSAILPQLWEASLPSSQGLEFFSDLSDDGEITHITIGFKKKDTSIPQLEMMIARLDELFLSTVYHAKK